MRVNTGTAEQQEEKELRNSFLCEAHSIQQKPTEKKYNTHGVTTTKHD